MTVMTQEIFVETSQPPFPSIISQIVWRKVSVVYTYICDVRCIFYLLKQQATTMKPNHTHTHTPGFISFQIMNINALCAIASFFCGRLRIFTNTHANRQPRWRRRTLSPRNGLHLEQEYLLSLIPSMAFLSGVSPPIAPSPAIIA